MEYEKRDEKLNMAGPGCLEPCADNMTLPFAEGFASVYALDVRCFNEPENYSRAYDLVSPKRRQRADRMRFAEDKALHLGAELLLRYGLKRLGYEGEPEIGTHEGGKPYLKNSDLYFSLSHSGCFALCALGKSQLGCDIQKKDDANLKIAERFFTAEEYGTLAEILNECQDQGAAGAAASDVPMDAAPVASSDAVSAAARDLFFRLWTLKESYIKMTGRGLRQPLNSFTVIPGKRVSEQSSRGPSGCVFWETDSIEGYCIALCVKDGGDAAGCPEFHIVSTEDIFASR